MHTCLKLVPLALFRSLELEESGFGLDTEITAKILKAGLRPFEVPVSYHSRSFEMGKKITWRDGVECLQVLTRVRIGRKPRAVLGADLVDSARVPAQISAAGIEPLEILSGAAALAEAAAA